MLFDWGGEGGQGTGKGRELWRKQTGTRGRCRGTKGMEDGRGGSSEVRAQGEGRKRKPWRDKGEGRREGGKGS